MKIDNSTAEKMTPSEENRILGRIKAEELSADEIAQVGGGVALIVCGTKGGDAEWDTIGGP